MPKYVTDQEVFWAGSFGDEYTERNVGEGIIAANLALFSRVLRSLGPINSVIVFGANMGLNLRALNQLLPQSELAAIEINSRAAGELRKWARAQVFEQSFLDFEPARQWDLALIKGVLIHINPDKLDDAYMKLYQASSQYICMAEYYSPTPVSIDYRGHKDRLFKRDFAGEMLTKFPDLELVDYGFCYRRDRHFPQDDLTWFLLRKTTGSVGSGERAAQDTRK